MLRTTLACGVLALAVPAAAAAQSAPPAAEFVAKAGASDKFEIEAGKLAETHGGSAAVKHFGHTMTIDHAKSTKLVKAAVRKSHMPAPPPPMLDDDQKAMIADLQGKRGKAFDAAYIPDQMNAHQAALDLVTAESTSGENPQLKAAATKIVPVVKMHIAMLQRMGG
jgi:putative membrane protein